MNNIYLVVCKVCSETGYDFNNIIIISNLHIDDNKTILGVGEVLPLEA